MLAVRKISAALLLPASIVLTGVWGALHLAPRGDLAGMISAGAGPYAELAEHLARLSATRQLVVSVERKTAPEQLARWVAELRGLDAVRRVDSQSLGLVDPEARQLGRQLFEARFALLEPQQALELPLRRYLRQLSLPLVADERMAVDPLGDRQRLQRRIAGPLATTSDWTLLSLTLSIRRRRSPVRKRCSMCCSVCGGVVPHISPFRVPTLRHISPLAGFVGMSGSPRPSRWR